MRRYIIELPDQSPLDRAAIEVLLRKETPLELIVTVADTTLATGDIVEAARELHCSDEIEIDEPANSSHGEDGVWVQAWVFVPGMGDEYVED